MINYYLKNKNSILPFIFIIKYSNLLSITLKTRRLSCLKPWNHVLESKVNVTNLV